MNLDLNFYWKLFWRRLPVMMLFVLLCSGLGIISALKLPETWSASARLLVESPQISDELVASTIETSATEQLDIIQQKLLTRANLIDIANRFNVFEDIRSMEPDTVVEQMQEATSIRRRAGNNQATLLTIDFEGRSGRIVADVVNEYTTLVLEENADFRGTRARNTLEFFEQEVERLGQDLDRQSGDIAVFKSTNVEALPEDQSYRLGRQTLLQERLAGLERNLNAAVAQRKEVVRIFESTGSLASTQDAPRRTLEQEQLIVANAEREQALSTWSETHPRVTRLNARIERLEAIVAAQQQVQTGGIDAQGEEIGPEQALLQANLAQIDSQLEFLGSDIETTKSELVGLQSAISQSSANGIELAALERGYINIQARYNAALNNMNVAQQSRRREDTAQGQRITVIENAVIPRIPTGPNRLRIAILGTGIGLALAGGFFMLLELLNRSVRRPAELISRFNVTPITVIPYMESRMERLVRRSAILSATLVVIIGVPLVLWYIDTNYLPLELVVQKGLEQLGLG